MESKITRLILFFLTCLSFCFPTGTNAQSVSDPFVRIAVFSDLKSLTLNVAGKVSILDAKTGRLLLEANKIRDTNIEPHPEGLRFGDDVFTVSRIAIIPSQDATIKVKNRRFRGKVNIIKDSKNRLLVVNTLGLEEYIKGVLYHEVSHRWPIEVLKAQAIAARTYALYRMQTTQLKDFDVTDDIYSQVYGGRNSERYRTNLAVDQTKGEILTFQGKILPAYFHATCAGATEDASELWKEDLPPLKGVVCEFCKKSPHYDWKKNLRSKDIQDKLNANGYHLGLIKEISVEEKNKSGRNRKLAITTRDGKTVSISGKDFRNIVGPNIIRSNKYDIQMKGYYFDLVGHGWGHGVGLCQWGGEGMARNRASYEDILAHYYPGAELKDFKNLPPLKAESSEKTQKKAVPTSHATPGL